ncbi:MAG: hypothetical protein JSV60_09740 [Desulfobacterales bacterium]|nr:MAG: hypothetical protein JSV60_09740 [Desulfobacterales bacterium]
MEEKLKMPVSQRLYGEFIYWITVVSAIICMVGPVIAMLSVENNVMNPHYFFAEIFAGKSAAEVWQTVGGGFPGGHFYLKHPFTGDGFTQFGLALGCMCAIPALIATAIGYLRQKPKVYLYAFLCIWVAFMVAVSAVGIVKAH